MLQQEHQELKRLILQPDSTIAGVQFPGPRVELHGPEARPPEGLDRLGHWSGAVPQALYRIKTSRTGLVRSDETASAVLPEWSNLPWEAGRPFGASTLLSGTMLASKDQ
jgi:hypothetical protein